MTSDVEFVCVLATGDAGVVAVAKSLLEGEEIDYFVKGENQEMAGLIGFNFAMGPAEFWVRADDGERARALLEDLIAP
jgi:hypothetical protein